MVHENNTEMAIRIAREVRRLGGTAYFVGGYVRDRIRKTENKDIDIEVHGLTPEQLESLLDTLGERMSFGESFGVYSLRGFDIDIAMPRKEEYRGGGHRDFDIIVDPFIGTYKAALRRDFTMNAIMEDILTGELVDHFGGINDIEHGIIRHINDTSFAEDSLRVLRAAQFAARFNYKIAPETVDICKKMQLSYLPKERILEELKKAMLKSARPSVFFERLRESEQLDTWFPELKQLIGIPQNPRFHSEGDVWTHSMMVLDAAAAFRDDTDNPFAFMLSAAVHDLGKILCTREINGAIHAYAHETLGLPLIDGFMHRLTNDRALIKYVMNLSEYHMKPNKLAADNASVKATNKMFDASVDPMALIYLAEADSLGSIRTAEKAYAMKFLKGRLAIYHEYMSRPYVSGRDLISAGLSPSGNFSDYLSYAHKLRLAGVDKDSALKQTLAYARKN